MAHDSFSSKASELHKILEQLRRSLSDVQDILLTDEQGLALVSTFSDPEKESRLAAMTSVLGDTSLRAVNEMSFGAMTNLVVTGCDGYIFIREVLENVFIALAIKPGVEWTTLIPRINWAVLKISDIGRAQKKG